MVSARFFYKRWRFPAPTVTMSDVMTNSISSCLGLSQTLCGYFPTLRPVLLGCITIVSTFCICGDYRRSDKGWKLYIL